MSVVWVAGGTGMLGQATARALRAAGHTPVCTGRQVDIASPAAVERLLDAHSGCTHILNCAAMTAVDACETDEAHAMRVNAHGPACLAAAAAARNLHLLHVSTDYVFDGSAQQPYDERATTAPVTAYGRSKLAGEQAMWRGLGERGRGTVVRTAWLFGHGGGNFVATMLRLMRERSSVQVVCDQVGSPTFCDDLADAMLSLAGLGPQAQHAVGTFHATNAGHTSWHGLAEATWQQARKSGATLACQRVEPVTSEAFVRPAKRPAYSVLDVRKVQAHMGGAIRPWQQALAQYLSEAHAA